MKIIFFGTPDYVLPILKTLYKHHQIVAVVTQPPKPVGRKKFLTYSPVDNWAHKRKIKIIRNFDETLPEADLGVVAAYGKIIPDFVIGHFAFGILNVHPSLLPKYRGASPIQETIKNGDTETGVTILKVDPEMDHGPIVSSFKEKVLSEDTTESLRDRLFDRASEFLNNLILAYTEGKISLKTQDHKKATFTKIINKEDGYVSLKDSPEKIDRLYKAMYPWPGIWTFVEINGQKKRLKIISFDENSNPKEVQLEGKNPVSFEEFKKGYPNFSFE